MFMRRLGTAVAGALILISALGFTSTASAAPSKPAPGAPGVEALTGYLLYNVTTGKCADIPGFGAGQIDGPVNQYTCNGSANDNQLFYLNPYYWNKYAPPAYQIQNVKDGLCLDLPFFDAVNAGTKVSEYHCGGLEDNQLFDLVPRQNGYWLVNHKSGLCLDVDGFGNGGNDARLTVWFCSDNDDHIWQLQ
jgi:hypothetical protein